MKLLFTLSGSSGSGKTTLLDLLSRDLAIDISVSHTTRERREYEIDGIHYHFVSKDKFNSLTNDDKFIEYENVHGDLYGTTKEGVECYLSEKKPLFLELDVKGALNLKKMYPENTVSIFLSAPNFKELESRLIHRSSESKEEINKRLSRFSEEENLKKEFDYTVINDNFESTFEELKKMILSMIKED
ncbi:MAG: guanylate kinase [Chloroflexi bacterium]|jgi:guanylate kinase|nr:guanylate kinase [Chloroflexota bacterium]|tara:strand:- start:1456 stop:2016 length:561 start_codon:yes stop_codon:yes gene_type:complete